jgi:CDP-diacylglycerol--glycerol-3-phosphate 3-phosphatidyltransferase
MVALLDLEALRLPGVIVIMLVLMVIAREFTISGLRMMAATRGVVMAAEGGGKIKTIIQLTALGCLLAEPMVARDLPRISPYPLGGVAAGVHWIGLVLFLVSMWFMFSSMWFYYRKYRHVLFDEPAA